MHEQVLDLFFSDLNVHILLRRIPRDVDLHDVLSTMRRVAVQAGRSDTPSTLESAKRLLYAMDERVLEVLELSTPLHALPVESIESPESPESPESVETIESGVSPISPISPVEIGGANDMLWFSEDGHPPRGVKLAHGLFELRDILEQLETRMNRLVRHGALYKIIMDTTVMRVRIQCLRGHTFSLLFQQKPNGCHRVLGFRRKDYKESNVYIAEEPPA